MRTSSPNELMQFIGFSEERLTHVKNGQSLAETLNKQKSKLKALTDCTKGVQYDSTENLLRRRISRVPKDLSPAMKEYYKDPIFSSPLESKKLGNLENFFIEKYQMVNAYIHGPLSSSSNNNFNSDIKRKLELNNDDLNAHTNCSSPFVRKLSELDKKINLLIQTEREKSLGKNRLPLKLPPKKKLSSEDAVEKFYTLNSKAKMKIQESGVFQKSIKHARSEKKIWKGSEKMCLREKQQEVLQKLRSQNTNPFLPSIKTFKAYRSLSPFNN
ncbi:hypothetical protein SteCoe_28684 [Stentor coeruleus]|uniref:Uncharacterized protein n=1 Tax=Stentor coeruleus TaxID=5963 RepID=A0A1R2B7M0_9CILI|nr:hypothetical protein SteCoe_28684 [Stentor coeruleus]